MSTSKKKQKYATGLLQRLPPQNLRRNLGRIVSLLSHSPDVIEYLLAEIDQPLKAKTEGVPPNAKQFIVCEYNRDGDAFRSPWSNTYLPNDDGAGYKPTKELRTLEVALNDVFQEYAALYYGNPVTSSAYVWGDGGLESSFAVAIAFLKQNTEFGTWNSIHILSVTGGGGGAECRYEMTSTVMLAVDAVDGMSNFNFGGTLVRKMTPTMAKEIAKHKAAGGNNPIATHVANIGDLVQKHENDLRAQIDQIYFGKGVELCREIRSQQKVAGGAENADTSTATALADPTKKKKKKIWQKAVDEEGNVYYYNTKTGETSWEKPQEGEEATTAVAQPPAANNTTDVVDEITPWLASLRLNADYSANFTAKYKKVSELATLMDADLVALGVAAFGDRKKIVKALKS